MIAASLQHIARMNPLHAAKQISQYPDTPISLKIPTLAQPSGRLRRSVVRGHGRDFRATVNDQKVPQQRDEILAVVVQRNLRAALHGGKQVYHRSICDKGGLSQRSVNDVRSVSGNDE